MHTQLTPLEQRIHNLLLALFKCAPANTKNLDMWEKWLNEVMVVWVATHDPINLWSTGEEIHNNPHTYPKGCVHCLRHFYRHGGKKQLQTELRASTPLNLIARAMLNDMLTTKPIKNEGKEWNMWLELLVQTWIALHDPINIWGTGEEIHEDPRITRDSGNLCILHFSMREGAECFRKELEGM
jgi:hypothetical protein